MTANPRFIPEGQEDEVTEEELLALAAEGMDSGEPVDGEAVMRELRAQCVAEIAAVP